jgi:hypothetical protein
MTEVTVVLKLRVADDACLVDWLPQLITDALEAEVGEELLSYDDTERFWPAEEAGELPLGMTQEQAQANYEQALANLATVH